MFLLFFKSFLISKAFAAACCGGGFAAPALIVGDDKAQLTASISYTEITDDVGTDSLWRKRNSTESTESLKIEAAHIFSDLWQAGISIPIIKRNRAHESSSGFGDVSATLGYEYLPDWDYNPWRPKGLGYLQITLPTGKPINESEANFQLDSRGRGYGAVGVGTILTKILDRWDVFANFDVHRSFSKRFSNSQNQGTLHPGYGGNLGLGAGYNTSALRYGCGLTWTYEDPVDVTGMTSSKGAAQRYSTASLSLSYLFKNEWASTLSYADQTWFGEPVNTTLGKSVMLFVQKRWVR